MKKIIIFLNILLSGFIYSQEITEISAKEAGLKSSPNPVGFFRGNDNQLYRTQRKDFNKENRFDLTLERYDEDLSLKFSTLLSFPDDREYPSDWIFLDNKIYLFTNHYDGANKTLHLRVLDKETGKVIQEKKQYGSLASDPFGKDSREFIIKLSADKTKICIISSFQWNKKPQEVKAILYEVEGMKQIAEYKFPDMLNNVLIKSYSYNLNSDGNLFYVFRNDVKEKDAPKKETLAIYNFQTKATNYKELEPSTKSLEYSRSFLKGDTYYITGSFTETISKKEKKVGTYCKTYNIKNLDQFSLTFDYYPADIETKLAYKDGSGKRELSEKEIKLTNVYETANGFYLVQNLAYTKETSGQQATYVKYYSREFLITKYNKDGKVEFVRTLPKYAWKDMYNSDIMESNGNLYVIYCEHPKNLEKYTIDNYDPSNYDDIGDIRGPVPVCVKITPEGKITRQNLQKNEDWCYYPGYGVKLKNGAQMMAVRVMKDQFIITVFKVKG